MKFDYSELLGRIRAVCKTQQSFAEAISISKTSVNAKLNNKSEWNSSEIAAACRVLNIDVEDIPHYFFCSACSETRTNNA